MPAGHRGSIVGFLPPKAVLLGAACEDFNGALKFGERAVQLITRPKEQALGVLSFVVARIPCWQHCLLPPAFAGSEAVTVVGIALSRHFLVEGNSSTPWPVGGPLR